MTKILSRKLLIILILLFTFFSTTSTFLLVYFTTELISLLQEQNQQFYTDLYADISLISIFLISSIINVFLRNKLDNYISKLVTNNIVDKIFSVPNIELSSSKSQENINWIKHRIPEFRSIVLKTSLDAATSFIVNIGTLFVLIVLSYKLALIGIGALILLLIFPSFLNLIINKHKHTNKQKEARFLNYLQTTFNGFRLFYYLGDDSHIIKYIDEILKKWIIRIDKDHSKINIIETINNGFTFIIGLFLVFITGFFIINQHQPVAIIFVLPSFFVAFSSNIHNLIKLNSKLNEYKSFYKKFNFEFKDVHHDFSKITFGSISINNLTYQNNNHTILNNINYEFIKGKSYAITANDKNTRNSFINILLKQINTYNGQISFDGENINNINTAQFLKSISYITSHYKLFDDSLYNNITLWEENQVTKVKVVLDIVELKNLDIDMQISEQSLNRSQKQRIHLARGLCEDNSIIILDDAFSNVEMNYLNKIFSYLKTKNIIIIHSTGSIKNLNHYDFILNLDNQTEEYEESI
ncbi:ATP-binding cassette domain-containing protein [Mycoplasma sp. 6243]|uniref:ATP-binding cassette domain-containing protein n=1 Tax=Mycoplasma sp. 6243 TaxID=3440865 RepID=UPI003EBE9FE6